MSLTPSSPSQLRAERTYLALSRIAERHGASSQARARQSNPRMVSPVEAVRLVALLTSGGASYLDEECEVDAEDLTAALTLVPLVRAELDELELGLQTAARSRGMTWADIAFGLGLGTAQAAKQRHDRLTARTTAEQ
ncbi:DNA-binding protein [Aeromicrobium sp. IC_218]|nr:DNA-binding protein [Aeromicrobium sp. IC_218]